jgi:hypothetical protein
MEMWLIGLGALLIVGALLLWMARLAQRADDVREDEAPPPTQPLPISLQPTANITREKVDNNLRRFSLAIEQNTKGKERDAELRRNLDFWKTLDIAFRSKGE